MNRLTVAIIFALAYLLVWWLLQPAPGWNGELTAYRWAGKGYRVMWKRGKAI
jgi:hypothetical protein